MTMSLPLNKGVENMGKSQELYNKAKKIIPGGTQLLSKRPEQFLPDLWPAYYSKAEGCRIWDLDGNEYVDMSYMGIGANVLGYADKDVDEAAIYAIRTGSMSTLNAPEEVELAELLLNLHPWASMVRYAKTGGEALAIAVRIARAFTQKDIVFFCGYHGWSDWYLSANLNADTALDGHLLKGLQPAGVPRGLVGTALPFMYNDLETFKDLIKEHKGKTAAVVLETIRNIFPDDRFLQEIRRITREEGIILIMDEVSSGFRLTCGGAHLLMGIEPDMAVFAKAMGNGYPMAAIIGRSSVMDSAQSTFISSTYWTERVGLCAAIATIKKYQTCHVEKHLEAMGHAVQVGWKKYADETGLKIHVGSIYPLSHFDFEYPNALVLKTLFTQEMLKKGYLATNAYYASYAHKEKDIEQYLIAVKEVFSIISTSIQNKDSEQLLEGPVCQTGFQRLT